MESNPDRFTPARGGQLAFVAVVAEGLVSTLAHAQSFESRRIALIFGLGVLYAALGVRFDLALRMKPVGYLAIEHALAISLVWLSHGYAGLAPLAVLSLSAFVLSRPFVIALAVMHTVSAIGAVVFLLDVHRLFGTVGPFIAAEVFVMAFTEVAIAERRAREELAKAHAKLARYATQTEELATMQERNRLARELHDSLGHYLTVIHVQLLAAESQLERDHERTRHALATAQRLAHEGLEDVRRSVSALRASRMDGRELADAVRDLTHELSAAGTPTGFSLTGHPRVLSPPVELAIFRAAQEALTNVRKHAQAANADVALRYERARVTLKVEDNGCGAPVLPERGFGLVGVRERARLLGGELQIRTSPGFSLTLSVPA